MSKKLKILPLWHRISNHAVPFQTSLAPLPWMQVEFQTWRKYKLNTGKHQTQINNYEVHLMFVSE